MHAMRVPSPGPIKWPAGELLRAANAFCIAKDETTGLYLRSRYALQAASHTGTPSLLQPASLSNCCGYFWLAFIHCCIQSLAVPVLGLDLGLDVT